MRLRRARAIWLGRRRYRPVHLLQRSLLEARKAGVIGDTILLVEHEPVITLGRGAKPENVLLSREALQQRGVDLRTTERGGDVTYHGPGQLVGYPIVDLSPDRCDVRRYISDLLSMMVQLAASCGVGAGRIERHVGVWVDLASPCRWPGEASARQPAKIGAVGVKISRWVTMHGFAFNVLADVRAFDAIIPCGIHGYGVTSLHELVPNLPALPTLAQKAAEHLCALMATHLLGFELVHVPDDGLCAALGIRAPSQQDPVD